MASTKLTRNNGSGDSRRKMTWSWWIKRSKLGATQYLYNQYRSADSYNSGVLFQSDDSIRFWDYGGSSNDIDLQTTRLFRDVNSWYHIVLAIDTTQGTASNRVKLYVNGVQETAFDVATYPNQNHELRMGEAGAAYQQQIGFQGYGSTFQSYFDGIMSHVIYIDGTQYAASDFGSTDATTGEWKINTSPSVTYGTNGFYILKDGNSVTNQAGNSSGNWTVSAGVLTKSEDCPSNLFATWNPLLPHSSLGYSLTYSYGNDNIQFNESSTWTYVCSTLGASSGKYYFEAKLSTVGSEASVGILELDDVNANQGSGSLDDYVGKHANSVGYFNNGRTVKNNNNEQTGLTALSAGNVVGVAMDLDNNTVQFYINGSSVGNAESISSNRTYFFGTSGYNSTKWECNFGNGYFADQTVSSAGTNASGNGIFEYNVPTGFTALSTKGLNL